VQINAGIVHDLAVGIATTAPKAFVLVISNPVNSTVPIVAEVFKKRGIFNPKRYLLRLYGPGGSVLIVE
jgi:malate dehydrogenase